MLTRSAGRRYLPFHEWTNSCGRRPEKFGQLVAVDQALFVGAVVARFMMLEPEVRHVVAQRQQEVIIAIVPRSEKRSRLALQGRENASGSRESSPAPLYRPTRYRFHSRELPRRKLNGAKIKPHQHRRIHQCVQRDRCEIDRVTLLLRVRQCRTEFPPIRNTQARHERSFLPR